MTPTSGNCLPRAYNVGREESSGTWAKRLDDFCRKDPAHRAGPTSGTDVPGAKDAKDDLKENGGAFGVNTILPFLALLASWR